MALELLLYQPDIPQNVGTILRLSACLGLNVHIIEPCGFPFDEKKLKRAAMDYIDHVQFTRYPSFDHAAKALSLKQKRLVLLTTKTNLAYTSFTFTPQDVLMVGKESAGVPEEIHTTIHDKVTIPMTPFCRSLNVAMAIAMVTGEALRQISTSPP